MEDAIVNKWVWTVLKKIYWRSSIRLLVENIFLPETSYVQRLRGKRGWHTQDIAKTYIGKRKGDRDNINILSCIYDTVLKKMNMWAREESKYKISEDSLSFYIYYYSCEIRLCLQENCDWLILLIKHRRHFNIWTVTQN